MNHVLRIVASLSLGVLGSIAALATYGCNSVESRGDRTLNAPIPASPDLAVSTRNGSIEVVVEPGRGDVLIEASIRTVGANLQEATDRLAQLELQAEERDGRLTIAPVMPSGWRGSDSVSFRIIVPQLDDIWLTTSNGALTAGPATGRAELRTSNGRIDAQAIGGEVVASSSNGAIEVLNSAGAVTASTSNGRILVRGAPGPVDASTSNGRIELEDVGGPLAIKTSNGRVTLRLRPDFAGSLVASTSNGTVTLAPSPAIRSTVSEKRSATLEFARPGPASKISTSNGSVDISIAPGAG